MNTFGPAYDEQIDRTRLKVWSIYQACSPSGKIYIGQTVKAIQERWGHHVWRANHGGSYSIHAAIRKYGAENFVVIKIDTAPSKKMADVLERKLIARYRSNEREFGYNLTAGGDGCPVTEEVKERMRLSKQFISPETRRKISVALKGNKNRLGNIHSEVSRARIGAKQAAYWARMTPEYKSARAKHARSKQGPISASSLEKIKEKAERWRSTEAGLLWLKKTGERFRSNNYQVGKVPWNKGMKFPYKKRNRKP